MEENELITLGLKLVSKLTFLGVGMPESEYGHVHSIRCQIYINPVQNESIPDSILIPFENDSHRIYLSIDINCPWFRELSLLPPPIQPSPPAIQQPLSTITTNASLVSQTIYTYTVINEEPVETVNKP